MEVASSPPACLETAANIELGEKCGASRAPNQYRLELLLHRWRRLFLFCAKLNRRLACLSSVLEFSADCAHSLKEGSSGALRPPFRF